MERGCQGTGSARDLMGGASGPADAASSSQSGGGAFLRGSELILLDFLVTVTRCLRPLLTQVPGPE